MPIVAVSREIPHSPGKTPIGMDRQLPIIAILTDRYFQYQAEIVECIESELTAAGYASLCVTGRELISANSVGHPHSVCNAIYPQVKEFGVSGMITLSGTLGHGVSLETVSEFLSGYSIPQVSLGMNIPGMHSVYLDENKGMTDLMEHLLCSGKRQRFAFVRGHTNDPYSLARESIFRESLQRYGHSLNNTVFLEGDYNAFATYQAVTQMLAGCSDIDCIVAANDVMAASAGRAAKAYGLNIPDDISISGFDDTSEATGHSPALSTVRQPVSKMALDAVKLLLKQIDRQTLPHTVVPESICNTTELIVRRSTNSTQSVAKLKGRFDELALRQLLIDVMDGLVMPESITMQAVSIPLWKTIDQGSVDIITLVKNISDAIIVQNTHWCINLTDHIYSISDQLLSGPERDRRLALVTSAIAKVKERIWALEMDRQFEASRQQNVRSDMLLAMSSCNDVQDIIEAMDQWLANLNPKRCFLIRYENMGPTPDKKARLIHVFRNGQSERIHPVSFESRQIVPMQYQDEILNGFMVLSPLYADSNLFGYILIDPSDMNLLYIDAAAQCIGNAIRTHHNIGVLQKQKSSLESVNAELEQLANFDALTGLANRLQFQDYLDECCAPTVGSKLATPFALLFIDLDGFKLINDTLGHTVGDMLLNTVALRLTKELEGSADYDGFIARLGGDEFTVILHPNTSTADIHNISNQFLNALSNSYLLNGNDISISASIGCALYPDDAADAESIVKRADIAMYSAKDNGKNNIALFSPGMKSADDHELQLAQALRHALDNEQMQMHYQPRIDITTGKMCAAEALMRWLEPSENGEVVRAYPDVFISLAEKIGVINQLDTYALHYSCKQAAAWSDAGIALPISVNVSVNHLQQPNFVATIADALSLHKVRPDLLELEITESAAMTDVENNIIKLTELKKMGIKVSIDDFGTGYSSLNYLKRLPVDNLKIDRSFITDILDANGGEAVDASIVRSIVALAHGMGFGLIAEGVETPAQAEFVRSLGCDEIQGYFYSKPITANEITKLLNTSHQFIDYELSNDLAA